MRGLLVMSLVMPDGRLAAGKDRPCGNVAQPGSAVGTKDGPGLDLAHGTTTQQVAGSNPAIPPELPERAPTNADRWQPGTVRALHGGQNRGGPWGFPDASPAAASSARKGGAVP